MTPQLQSQSAQTEAVVAEDRRKFPRHPGKATAELVREADALRQPLRVELLVISLSGVGLTASEAHKVGDHVRVRLRNDVQRFYKEVRGVIRWVQPIAVGRFRIGVELAARFTAIDMQILKRAGVQMTDGGAVWI